MHRQNPRLATRWSIAHARIARSRARCFALRRFMLLGTRYPDNVAILHSITSPREEGPASTQAGAVGAEQAGVHDPFLREVDRLLTRTPAGAAVG